MELASKYDPQAVEAKWYEYWLNNKLFSSKPDGREPYTVVIPPPNVTGVLHMGHMLNNTIQDILVRRARMEGKNACWVPGTDHASIATEAKVVARLAERGIETWIRFVLVPGLTDSEENVEAVAQIVEKWPNVSRVEVLPFHQMGRDKWKTLGLKYELNDTQPPDKALIERTREIFRSHGLTVY